MNPATCIVCDKELGSNDPSSGVGIAMLNDATIWRSHGNYGSTLYDPMSGKEFLEAYVCDECLVRKGKQVRAVKYESRDPVLTFDDTFVALQAKEEEDGRRFRAEQERALAMAKKIIADKVEELGSIEAVHEYAAQEHAKAGAEDGPYDPEKLLITRMLNQLTASRIDGEALLEYIKERDRKDKPGPLEHPLA